jgi:hypothetical protein
VEAEIPAGQSLAAAGVHAGPIDQRRTNTLTRDHGTEVSTRIAWGQASGATVRAMPDALSDHLPSLRDRLQKSWLSSGERIYDIGFKKSPRR